MKTAKEYFWLIVAPILLIISLIPCLIIGAVMGIYIGFEQWKTGWFE